MAPVAPWHGGTLALCHVSRTLSLWCWDTVVPRHHDTMAICGPMAPWHHYTMGLQDGGIMALWYCGTMA